MLQVLCPSDLGRLALGVLLALVAAPVDAAEPVQIPHHQDAPPGPALSPEAAIARMSVPEGFSVELVAAEPDLVNPVAMTFDERGRIWVAESLEYPRLDAGTGRDRIRVLEDTDADGRADRFTTFAEGLNIPSGIAVGYGGVWVANAPDILFLQDNDGDLVADSREVVLTGFGRDDTHELPNSLTWGPDGWLYGLNGVFNRSRVEQEGRVCEFTCAMFRIHPRTRRFEIFAEGTSNPWGIAWDGEGSAFVSACVIDHLWHIVETGYYHRQAGAYPPHTWKIESIVDHQHQKAAYCGIHYFDSPAYPQQYRRRLYMGNIHGNCINADVLSRRGATYRGDGEADLLSANDAWFMPVAQKTGPDGCLYILDWYDRYHCYQDARRDADGIDRGHGRLYRLRYGDTPRAAQFDLAAESDEQLIARFHDENVYYRDIAQRLLAERAAPESRPALEALVFEATAPRHARLHALWSLLGSGDLNGAFHARLLAHADPTLRAWGVRAAGNVLQRDDALCATIAGLTHDESPDVRLQVAIAAAKLDGLDTIPILLDVLSASTDDPLIPHIVWQNLNPLLEDSDAAARFVQLVTESGSTRRATLKILARRTVDRLLARDDGDVAPVADLLSALLEDEHPRTSAASEATIALADAILEHGVRGERRRTLRERIEPRLGPILARGADDPLFGPAAVLSTSWDGVGAEVALNLLVNEQTPTELRTAALRALVRKPRAELWERVGELLGDIEGSSARTRHELLLALSHAEDRRVADLVLEAYPRMEPELQSAAIVLLAERLEWGRMLIDAVESGTIPPQALSANQVRKLLAAGDDELARRVREHWGVLREDRNPEREAVIQQVRAALAREPGDPQAGTLVFKRVCAECHKLYGEGQDVGPDITLNGRNSYDQLLSNVLDPSLVVGAAYQARTLVTTDGRVLTGLVAEESDGQVTLKVQGGRLESVSRDEIDEMDTSPLSMMPEGIERQLTPRELADLFAYLSLDRPPSDPAARRLSGAP